MKLVGELLHVLVAVGQWPQLNPEHLNQDGGGDALYQGFAAPGDDCADAVAVDLVLVLVAVG